MELIEIGEVLRHRRQFLNLLQTDIKALSGVNTKTIQQIESGKGNPSFETLQKIASVLGMQISVQVKDIGNG